jgi:M6 family metalloprotease-like protein
LAGSPPDKLPEKKPALPDLSEYRTVETATAARVSRAVPSVSEQPGYLGIHVEANATGKLTVGAVATDSPAAKAGLERGDLLSKADGRELAGPDALRDFLATKSPGDQIQLALLRKDKPVEVTARLAAPSRPRGASQRALLGLQIGEPKPGEGAPITQIVAGSPADRAKLKLGEVILKLDNVPLTGPEKLRELLVDKKPEDTVTLTLLLAEKTVEMKVQLGAESSGVDRSMGWDRRGGGIGGGYWKKDVYRLAVICIDYPDVKHNPKITAEAWSESFFSKGTYSKTNATGQPVFGSLNDYYLEQSFGALRVEGKVFNHIEVSKKRAEYGEGNNRFALLTEAMDKILERDGKDALKDYDGVMFIYSGGRMQVARGSLYWPHRASVSHQGKRWPYFICGEGGDRMGNISVFCHEFGHMLGLPDLYARPENPGSEGVSVWCAMSNQAGNGRPQHFCAWSKEKLEWIKPMTIDPTIPQKLILGPIEDSPKECFKVLVRPDGSEYLLLENRRKKGFDQSLPAEGLLIWRVVRNRPILEESHGVEGSSGPRVFPTSVPYPTTANDAFTPYTTPSSRSQLGGGLPVHVTNIRRLPDGRITFHIGHEYQ